MTVYRFVEQEKARHPVRILCEVLGVSPSGYYAWRRRGPSAHALADQALARLIIEAHQRSRGTYGAPRIHEDVREDGHRTSRKRIARLMREQGLTGLRRRRFVATTIADPGAVPAPDLVRRDFSAPGPDRLWVADITQLPTRAGPCYLAAVTDAWSRRVVGWSIAGHMRTELVTAALDMALARRRPGEGLVHHSDRGSQGGFHRSSQHLETEALRWAFGSGGWRSRRRAGRSGRQEDHRSRDVKTVSGSGTRSPGASRRRTPPLRWGSRRRSEHAGSGRLGACRPCRSFLCRPAT